MALNELLGTDHERVATTQILPACVAEVEGRTLTMIDIAELFRKFEASPLHLLSDLPNETGIYWLADHDGKRRYVGITDRLGFLQRINKYHCAGDETNSHKFSCNYNVGRMYRGPKDRGFDALKAKKLRSCFIRKHCSAACLPIIAPKEELERVERQIIALAQPDTVAWNHSRNRLATFEEPTELVDQLIAELGWSDVDRLAVDRQSRFSARAKHLKSNE